MFLEIVLMFQKVLTLILVYCLLLIKKSYAIKLFRLKYFIHTDIHQNPIEVI